MAQDAVYPPHPPTIVIDGYKMEVVENVTYLGLTISTSLSIDTEVNSRITKAAAAMVRLKKRVWNNPNLTEYNKLLIYKVCVLSTLLYSSKTWATYVRHERKLNSFHLRCLRRILCIQWQDKVPNSEVLERASMNSLFTTLSKRHLRWLGHIRRMKQGRIPKDLLYSELVEGSRPTRCPLLCYKDICKKDMKLSNIIMWESSADDRSAWHLAVRKGIQKAEEARHKKSKEEVKTLAASAGVAIIHLQQMRQRLSFKSRTIQPLAKVQTEHHPTGSYTIVSRI
ncbi:uncharacterized protein LOC127425195 [Myxocyprinus asiaticus]|uniref:uncharacterized protein LOC127425195 n=1 Tax=Myxocyprinus asiaticus TaxID=70543 RepID=UPI0022223F1C|nr:uncharacterized protein LOC127425195 [Myxocyprinus asiaticus]XP_051526869.1 uncharacterized protein LOC127425195 [Myxocyprinus asiaticus]